MMKFQSPPPATKFSRLSYPAPHILLVTLCRPRALNCINAAGHEELDAIWRWLDAEPALRVGIITGEGRAFCAGADLKEWEATKQPGAPPRLPMPPSGFGGLSRRRGRKPIIAAVNGLALGGGCEIVTNCDMVFASPGAVFALPEVKIGVAAIAGALPRLVRVIGRMRAMEMALTGRDVGAEEALRWGLCNAVAEKDGRTGVGGSVVELAVRYAEIIAAHSPDSVVVSKEGIELGWDGISVEEATDRLSNGIWKGLEEGDNVKEGLRAFVEKRPPIWVPSKL